MAEKELWKLCQTAKNKYPSIGRITAVHILGDCPVGAASGISCASSPHRKDAIHTIEYLIDALKATVPIWKREVMLVLTVSGKKTLNGIKENQLAS